MMRNGHCITAIGRFCEIIALRNFYDVEHAFCKVLADNGQDFFLDRAGFNIKLPNNRQFD